MVGNNRQHTGILELINICVCDHHSGFTSGGGFG